MMKRAGICLMMFAALSAKFFLGCTDAPPGPGKEAWNKLAFSRGDTLRFSDIYVMNSDGTEETRITSTSASWSAEPKWSPNGMTIAFRSFRNGSIELYAVRSDGSDERQLTDLPQSSDKGGHAWSPDGMQLAFHADDGIHTINADGTGHRHLVNKGDTRYPSWSPDGGRIVFSLAEGQDSLGRLLGAISMINVDGTNLRRLTGDSVNAHFPAWLPDGVSIAWMGVKEMFFDIYVTTVDGSASLQLTSDLDVTRMSVSPDGTRIAFFHYVSLYVHDLYVVTVDGGGLQKLNPTGFQIDGGASISWYSDGKRIAFDHGYSFANHPDDYGMYAIHLDDTRLRYVGKGEHPDWQPKSSNHY